MKSMIAGIYLVLLFACPVFAAVDIAALRTELQTDPQVLGYAACITTGNDQCLADTLNLARAGASYQVPREPMDPNQLMDAIAPADTGSLSTNDLLKLNLVFQIGLVDLQKANIRSLLASVFAANSTTRTNIQALINRQGSRAEVLFGRGTVVTVAQIAQALRG